MLMHPAPCKRGQAGLSLVELLVGITIGMFIVAAAAFVLSSQLNDNRRLVVEAQIQQDLRATTDIITRELRRAGYWKNAPDGIWVAGATSVKTNPYSTVALPGDAATGSEVRLSYFRPPAVGELDNDLVDDREQAGFRLNGGALQVLLGAGNWQTLTDPNTLKLTRFVVTLASQPVPLVCHTTCVDAATCPPRINVRQLSVAIEGEAASDARVKRSMNSTVRLHNDTITGSCP